jgi:hypothetical protein
MTQTITSRTETCFRSISIVSRCRSISEMLRIDANDTRSARSSSPATISCHSHMLHNVILAMSTTPSFEALARSNMLIRVSSGCASRHEEQSRNSKTHCSMKSSLFLSLLSGTPLQDTVIGAEELEGKGNFGMLGRCIERNHRPVFQYHIG